MDRRELLCRCQQLYIAILQKDRSVGIGLFLKRRLQNFLPSGFDEFLLKFFRMLQIVILVFFFSGVKAPEGFHADVDRLACALLQPADTVFGNSFLLFREIVNGQSIGMAPVDELSAPVEGVHTSKEDIHQLGVADFFLVVVDPDGLPMHRPLYFTSR